MWEVAALILAMLLVIVCRCSNSSCFLFCSREVAGLWEREEMTDEDIFDEDGKALQAALDLLKVILQTDAGDV